MDRAASHCRVLRRNGKASQIVPWNHAWPRAHRLRRTRAAQNCCPLKPNTANPNRNSVSVVCATSSKLIPPLTAATQPQP
eukprot:8300457-Alexandrium_andersonii.AAC.1